jgi:hypothetical protein
MTGNEQLDILWSQCTFVERDIVNQSIGVLADAFGSAHPEIAFAIGS